MAASNPSALDRSTESGRSWQPIVGQASRETTHDLTEDSTAHSATDRRSPAATIAGACAASAPVLLAPAARCGAASAVVDGGAPAAGPRRPGPPAPAPLSDGPDRPRRRSAQAGRSRLHGADVRRDSPRPLDRLRFERATAAECGRRSRPDPPGGSPTELGASGPAPSDPALRRGTCRRCSVLRPRPRVDGAVAAVHRGHAGRRRPDADGLPGRLPRERYAERRGAPVTCEDRDAALHRVRRGPADPSPPGRRTPSAATGTSADDLLQTALVKLYVAWPRLQRDGREEAYVRQIIVRANIDEHRRPWRRERPGLDGLDRGGPRAAAVEERSALFDALQDLPPMQRKDRGAAALARAVGRGDRAASSASVDGHRQEPLARAAWRGCRRSLDSRAPAACSLSRARRRRRTGRRTRRTQACIAIAAAAEALIDRVEPNWAIEKVPSQASRAGSRQPRALLAEQEADPARASSSSRGARSPAGCRCRAAARRARAGTPPGRPRSRGGARAGSGR